MTEIRIELSTDTVGKVHYASKLAEISARQAYSRLIDTIVYGLEPLQVAVLLAKDTPEQALLYLYQSLRKWGEKS